MSESNVVSAVEERLRLLEDRLALIDLEAEYAVAWDLGNGTRWAACFTEDGVFEMAASGEMQGARYQGTSALSDFCSMIKSQWSGIHFMHLPRLTVNGDVADAIVFFEYKYIARMAEGYIKQGSVSGYYEVAYVRTPNGWKMENRLEYGAIQAASGFAESSLNKV